tara:strand:- start:234 stop:1523 length:1290 start_codon:yes stop_codon:yes gene_type:complete
MPKLSQEDRKFQEIVKLYEQRDYAKAIEIGEEFTKKYSQNGAAWNLLGLSYKAAGNIAQAIRIFEFLIKSKSIPDSAMFHSNLGNTFMLIGRITEGISCFRKAIELEPDMINAIEALGLAYLETDQREEAARSFERVLKLDSNHQRSLYFLGNLYLTEQNWASAAKYLRKSNFGLSQSHYLECLLCLGQGKEFLNFYKKLSKRRVINPLVGGLVAHVQKLYERDVKNIFCDDAMNHIYVGRIEEEDGFSDKLANELIEYHRSNKNDYRSQSLLHNGSQSSGNLFLLDEPFATKLKFCIEKQVELYRSKFKDSEQGFLNHWPKSYELFGWLVSIKSGGNLDAHNHKEGWLSGSFYLSMPRSEGRGEDDGNIAFSYQGPKYPSGGRSSERRVVDVRPRDICMFPSSLFHETVPFKGNEERISFAFDVKPIN